jgi:hypothetical protein
VNLTGLEPSRLREEPRHLLGPDRPEDGGVVTSPSQVLRHRTAKFGVLDDGLVDTPTDAEVDNAPAEIGNFEPTAHTSFARLTIRIGLIPDTVPDA